MDKNKKIYVAGHNGMVGSAICRRLKAENYREIVVRDRENLDLLDQRAVNRFFEEERPEVVFLAAARVGGIMANSTNQAAFLYENLQIQNNVISAAREYGTRRFVFLSSSCIYPRLCEQPMKEKYLLSGPLEPTNEGYALAKIAGMKLLEYYHDAGGFSTLSVVPCNLFGENDNFDLENGHVLASLVHRFVDAVQDSASEVALWGTGLAFRELMHVDDMVDALFFVLEKKGCDGSYINIGTGVDVQIRDLAAMIASVVHYKGKIIWNTARPDGMPRKCLDVSRLKEMGWESKISLEKGIPFMVKKYEEIKRGLE